MGREKRLLQHLRGSIAASRVSDRLVGGVDQFKRLVLRHRGTFVSSVAQDELQRAAAVLLDFT